MRTLCLGELPLQLGLEIINKNGVGQHRDLQPALWRAPPGGGHGQESTLEVSAGILSRWEKKVVAWVHSWQQVQKYSERPDVESWKAVMSSFKKPLGAATYGGEDRGHALNRTRGSCPPGDRAQRQGSAAFGLQAFARWKLCTHLKFSLD